MPYSIGVGMRNSRTVLAAQAGTAREALAIIDALKNGEELKFIASPQEGEIGIEMLLLLAKEEAEEMPAVADR